MVTKLSLQEAVDSYILALRANGRARNTIYNVGNTLRLWQGDVGDLSLRQAAATIPSYLSQRLDTLSHNSGVVEFQRLRCFMRYCVGQHWLPDSPLEGMRPPRTMDTPIAILSDAQIQALLDAGDAYDRAALFLMLGSGMRIGEVAALRWADCTGDRLTVHGKGSKIRRVEPGVIAMRTLEELPRKDHRVFPMSVGVLKWRMWRLSERTGIPFHAHLLRHSFAMRFIRAGGTIDELSRLLGHAKIDTTATYLRADLEERALAAQRRLNPADIFWQGPQTPAPVTPAVGGYGNIIPFRPRAAATG
jgi:integrase